MFQYWKSWAYMTLEVPNLVHRLTKVLRAVEEGKKMEGSSSSSQHFSSDLYVDELYLSVFDDSEEVFPISDEKYAEELQLQEALVSSVISSKRGIDQATAKNEVDESPLEGKRQKEMGQSSQSFCVICMESNPPGDMFRSGSCSHTFCTDCITRYVAIKIQENILQVKCPDPLCVGELGPQCCQSIIPKEVFDRWETALCESSILAAQKFYCPFKDCSTLLLDDGDEVVTMSECPNCRRLFCAQCKVAWHSGMDCQGFKDNLKNDQKEREETKMMEDLAKNKKWRRCPQCKFFVEKKDGCQHIVCRCKNEFCYACGAAWSCIHFCRS